MTHPLANDRRVRRTRKAIFDAFRELVLSQPYDSIHVCDIVERADVGRSTFYQHYSGKDQVLTESITWLFEALADAAVGRPDVARLDFVLDHFKQQRAMARAILRDQPLRLLTDRLAELIEQRQVAALPARARAAAQLEVISSWLSDRVAASRAELTEALMGSNSTVRLR
ncbi:MAG: helix-turn-helix domain-containing protein [Pseudomonadota bacterium]